AAPQFRAGIQRPDWVAAPSPAIGCRLVGIIRRPRRRGTGVPAMLISNVDESVPLVEPGQVWLRKRSSAALVRRVRTAAGAVLPFEPLPGPASLRRTPLGSCRLRSFVRPSRRIEEQPDYSHLDGARRFDTFLVLTTAGEPLLRCSAKRARFYLRKGY